MLLHTKKKYIVQIKNKSKICFWIRLHKDKDYSEWKNIYWGQETSTMDGGNKDTQIFQLPHLLLFPSAYSDA